MEINWASDFAVLAARYGDRVAVQDESGTLTYRDLFALAAGLADRLVTAGVRPGTPVATFVPNGRAAAWASLGVTLAGAAEVPMSPAQAAEERAWCLGLIKARHVVTPALLGDEVSSGEFCHHVLEDIRPASLDPGKWPRPTADDWGRVLFTSGTTGRPKGAVHSHAGRWLANAMLRLSLPFRPGAGDTILLMTPFPHGASLLTYAFLFDGAGVHLLDGVRLEQAIPLITGGSVNHLFAPPTVLAKIAAAAEGRRFETVRTVFTGTAALSPTLYRSVRRIFGPVVRVTYGMTEIFNPITVLQPAECEEIYERDARLEGSCLGWPAPGVEISIRDDEGREAEAGVVGEIHVRAPHMFLGYVTRDGFSPLAPGDFYATGDLGHFNRAGGLYFVGRRHDIIKTGGYKVFPQEVEAALGEAALPVSLAVLGLPSEYWGEVIVAVGEAAPADWSDRIRAAAASLTKHKRPRAYVSVPSLPRNAIGKVDRTRLRVLILERYRLFDGPYPRLEAKA